MIKITVHFCDGTTYDSEKDSESVAVWFANTIFERGLFVKSTEHSDNTEAMYPGHSIVKVTFEAVAVPLFSMKVKGEGYESISAN